MKKLLSLALALALSAASPSVTFAQEPMYKPASLFCGEITNIQTWLNPNGTRSNYKFPICTMVRISCPSGYSPITAEDPINGPRVICRRQN